MRQPAKGSPKGATGGEQQRSNAVIANFHPVAFLVAATPPGQKKNHLSISARSCEKGSEALLSEKNSNQIRAPLSNLIPESPQTIFFSLSTRLIFLGTATSVGVPIIGCDCEVCTSPDPRNKRTRSSLYLESNETRLLVDTGPDLREQALRERLHQIDHVLYTHDHLDHVAGFDELRAFCWHREDPLPIHASAHTLTSLQRMYPWAFGNTARNYVRPSPRPFIDFQTLSLGDITVQTFPVEHGATPTHGFLFTLPTGQRISYSPDVKSFPPPSKELLKNVDLLIIDALREQPHQSHMSFNEALEASAALAPKQTALTHLTHELDFAQTTAKLPPNIFVATDGLTLSFNA